MFKNLLDFGVERSGKEAFGFFLAYLLLASILGALIGGTFGLITGDDSFEVGVQIGNVISIFYCIGLAIAVGHFKGLFFSFSNILLVITSGLLAVFLGALGGLIPVAYLSTVKNEHNK